MFQPNKELKMLILLRNSIIFQGEEDG